MNTAEQIAANRAAAVQTVRAALNLSDRVPADWTYAERTGYNKALAAYIAARPEQFSDAELRGAEAVAKNNYTAIEDAGFDVGMFVAETVKPGIDAVKSVGEGVLTTAKAAKWVIPVVAGVAVVLLLVHFNRKLGTK